MTKGKSNSELVLTRPHVERRQDVPGGQTVTHCHSEKKHVRRMSSVAPSILTASLSRYPHTKIPLTYRKLLKAN